MFFDKKLLRKMDVKLLLAVTAIIIISLIVIGSATHVNTPSEERYWFVQRQGMFALINAGVAIFLMNFDYKMLQRYGQKMYIFNLVMLLAVMFVGQSALGAQRWIQLGPITLQPSEFSKIIMIVSLAALLQEKVGKLNTLSDLLPVAAYVGVPFLLVMKQPDLGTSLVFMAIFFGMIFACGINLKLLAGIFGTGIACMPLLWHVLKDYQKMRIMVFLDPNVDPLGSGYHIIQSKIAIGSGGIYGKGWLQGSQSQLDFLPEPHTDFIFAVLSEETGLIGFVILMALYCFIIWRSVVITMRARENFERILAGAFTFTFMFYIFVNIGMVSGILPVVGVPLPFVSYGGTSMATLSVSFGIIMSIHTHKKVMIFGK